MLPVNAATTSLLNRRRGDHHAATGLLARPAPRSDQHRYPRCGQLALPDGSSYDASTVAPLVCGRYTSAVPKSMLRERFEVEVPDAYEERYNVAPSQRVLAVR